MEMPHPSRAHHFDKFIHPSIKKYLLNIQYLPTIVGIVELLKRGREKGSDIYWVLTIEDTEFT